MAKTSHILSVSGGHGPGRMAPPVGFTRFDGGLAAAVTGHAWFGPRPYLETLRPVASNDHMGSIIDAVSRFASAGEEGPHPFKGDLSEMFGPVLGMFREKASGPKVAYPDQLQIIPYILFRHRGQYLRYLRTTTGGDARLHGKISIGIGGHVDLGDAVVAGDGSIDIQATLDKAFRRETKEEIGLDLSQTGPRWVATLYATDTEVDTVHLGIVGIYDLSDVEHDQLKVNEEIGDHRFASFGDILAEAKDGVVLETWTRLVIESNPLA